MAGKDTGMVTFEFGGFEFEAVKSELESYETNKQLAMGGTAFYEAVDRIFAGRDVEYCKKVGGSFSDMTALVNAAFAAYGKAKN